MAEVPKGDIQTNQGPPQNATPKESESTEPQPGIVEPTKRYVLNKNEEPIIGADFVKLANQGRMLRQIQSENDKLKANYQKTETELKQAQEALKRIEQENLIREQITRLSPKRPMTQEGNWPEEEAEESQEQIDPEEIVRQVSQQVRQPVDELINTFGLNQENVKSLPDLINQIMEEREARQKQAQDRDNWLKESLNHTKRNLSTKYGNGVDEATFNSIMDAINVSNGKLIESTEYSKMNDYTGMADAYVGSVDALVEAVEKLADAKIKSMEKARQDELQSQLSSNRYPGIAPPEQGERQSVFKDADYRDRRKKAVQDAAKRQEAAMLARRQLGGNA